MKKLFFAVLVSLLVGYFTRTQQQKKPVILNVLPTGTFQNCRIKGSLNVALEELSAYAKKLDRDTPIIVYSKSFECSIAPQAYRTLKNMNFTDVKVYTGGMNEWYFKGLPSEGDCNLDYLKKIVERPEKLPHEVSEVITLEEMKNILEIKK